MGAYRERAVRHATIPARADLGIGAADLEQGVVSYPAHFVAKYRRSGAWTDETVGEMLAASAATTPRAIAAAGGDWSLAYVDLLDQADRFGAALLDLGLAPRDRVLFQLGNAPETIVAYYGTIRAGLIPVCSIPAHGEHDMKQLAAQTRARAHLVQADFAGQDLQDLAARVAAGSEYLEHLVVTRGEARSGHSFENLLDRVSASEAEATLAGVEVSSEDVVVFQLSGGTTGTPKVIPRIHCDYVLNARAWARAAGWDRETKVMHIPPLIHNAGISASMQPVHSVGGQLTLSATPRIEEVLELIERERVQVLPLVPPAIVIRLIEHPGLADYDLSSLRQMFVGGQNLAPDIARAAEEALGIPCNQKFGMGEGMFFRTPDDAPTWVRHHTVGAPIVADDEVRVLEVGAERPVPIGEVGELCCRGPYTIRGYFEAPEHNAVAFTSDGFYRTGDLARQHIIDGRSYFSIEGRIKDVINRGAEKISATEIEELTAKHPGVAEVAVVAMPDRELGERACAFVVPVEATEPVLADLIAFLLDSGLAKFKLPERLELVAELPLTNIGKVDKKVLRERIASILEDEDR